MPQEPKKRHSRARQGKRRAAIRLTVSKLVVCSNCKKEILAHKVCKYCGFYKGREIVDKQKKEKERETKEESK